MAVLRRSEPDEITDVDRWSRRVLATTPARPGVLSSGVPSISDLTAMARAIATEISFERGAKRLQDEAAKLAGATESLLVVLDWPRGKAWTLQGPIENPAVLDLVMNVAGSGRRSILGNALLQPIGPAPSRAVLALRKPGHYSVAEVAMISGLTNGIAPSIERLLER